MATRKTTPKATESKGPPSLGMKAVTLTIHRPNGVVTTVQGMDLSVTVVANGALLVVGSNGRSYTAFSAGQWLTVGTPPV